MEHIEARARGSVRLCATGKAISRSLGLEIRPLLRLAEAKAKAVIKAEGQNKPT